jgi:hypothetical protein
MPARSDTPLAGDAQPQLAASLSRLVQQALSTALHEAAAADAPPLRLPAAPQPSGIELLAGHHPGGPATRRDALALYRRCLEHYRSRLQPQLSPGHADDDLGAAAAFFVLANLGALHDAEPDPALLRPVERQLRHWLAGGEALPLAERQRGFEQLAALGVLVNESRVAARSQGEAARRRLHEAARGYLLQLLGLDPDRLTVSTAGLAWGTALH